MSTQHGSDSTAAQSKSTEQQYIQLCFFTPTLMFRLLPMVTFNIQYFTLSLAIETCGELGATVHRQSWADTQCRLKGCGGFTAGRHFYTAWLQWVCVASWDKTKNLNRRCSLVLMSHACAKNPLVLLTLCFLHERSENSSLSLTIQAQALCPKGTISQWKKTVITQCIWWGYTAEGHRVGPPSSHLNVSDN